jgi:hypothetical protein
VGRSEFGLSNIGGVLKARLDMKWIGSAVTILCKLHERQSQQPCASHQTQTRRDSGDSHPSCNSTQINSILECLRPFDQVRSTLNLHLVVEDLGFTRFRLWDQGLVQNIEDILTHLLKLRLDLLAVLADSPNMFVRSLGLLLLLDGRDYAPGSTSSSDNILISNREKVTLIDRKFSTKLQIC